MRKLTVRSFFSRNGPLSEAHPNYEFRKGQLEMALAVEDAIAEKRHQIVEAGTGTGKTLAYLVPALLSGKRILISTGTKNLQEQLFYKDIPFLERFFPGGIKACLMKGRANYLCRRAVQGFQPFLLPDGRDGEAWEAMQPSHPSTTPIARAMSSLVLTSSAPGANAARCSSLKPA